MQSRENIQQDARTLLNAIINAKLRKLSKGGGGSMPTDLIQLEASRENPAGIVLNNKDSIISDEEGLLIQALLIKFEGILQTQRLSMPVLDDVTGDGIIGYSQGNEGDVLTVKSGFPIWKQPQGGGGSGLSETAITLLLTILRAGTYTTDMSSVIDELEAELTGRTGSLFDSNNFALYDIDNNELDTL